MPSKRQIEANKKNAQLSTGPKTPEGRAAIRLNGVKHGLTAQSLVLPGESKTEFENLLAALEAEHQPATPTEQILVAQLAMATWRMRRFYNMEAGFFSIRLLDTKDKYVNINHAECLGVVVDRSDTHTLTNLSRYEARLERSFYRALQELQRLRAQRQANVKNQTQSQDRTPVEVSDPPLHPAPLPRPVPALVVEIAGDTRGGKLIQNDKPVDMVEQ